MIWRIENLSQTPRPVRTKEEDYWFNVGGITGMIAIFIVILPCMFLGTIIKDMVTMDKLVYGIVPMLTYLLFLLWKSKKVIALCEKLAIQDMRYYRHGHENSA